MAQWIQELLDSLLRAFTDALEWIRDGLSAIALWVWEQILDGLATVLESIPMPEWWVDSSSVWGGITGEILWFLDPFEIPAGLGIVGSAYLIRFLIRRLPLVG